MSSKHALTQESIGTEDDQEETFAFAPVQNAGRVNVANLTYGEEEAKEHTYSVSIDDLGHAATACTCPAAKYHAGKCKHMRSVESEKEVLATAAPKVRTAGSGTFADEIAEAVSRSFSLGIDAHGKTHHYWRGADTVVVFDELNGVEHRQHLGGRSLGEWVDFVAEDRGWESFGQLAHFAEHVDAERGGAEQ